MEEPDNKTQEGPAADVASTKQKHVAKNEKDASSQKSSFKMSFNVEVDWMLCLILLVSMATRMWRLEYPAGAVFDEVHFGKMASMYLRRIFHFDLLPPLGKMLIALAGYYAGFSGEFKIDQIGADFTDDIPVWHLRFFPSFMGSLVAPVIYQLVLELGLNRWTACLAATLIILDNALLVQSRFMLVEGILLLFISLTLLAYVKFRDTNQKSPFSGSWWLSSIVMAVCGTFALSVRYLGAFTLVLVLFLSVRDLWVMLPDIHLTDKSLTYHILSRLLIFGVIPLSLYTSVFYVHLSILTKAGPHDGVLTSSFQASLEGGLATITRGQPLGIMYGSQVTLRHTHGSICWLHSHNSLYPVQYKDKRGSSHQQQVTCYKFKDVNNWWIIKNPNDSSLVVQEPKQPVRDGDIIQVVHGMTGRALNSHDVAAPASPQHQEVSGYIDHNISSPAQNLWQLDIINGDGPGDTWKTIQSHVRLRHVNSSQSLKITGKVLPDWGFNQLEVATDKVASEQTVWNVEEHRYAEEDETKSKAGLEDAEMIPLQPTYMSFIAKFLELQMKMLMPQVEEFAEHRYSSDPLEWPLLDTNIAYWVRPTDFAQIHLLGNPVVWYSGAVCTVVYVGLLIIYMLRRRRGHHDLQPEVWSAFVMTGEMLLSGYGLHYVPYLLLDQTLFLYLYLPALIYQIILTSALVEHIFHIIRWRKVRTIYLLAVGVWLCWVARTFVVFLPITYGLSGMSPEQLQHLKWSESWSFLRKLN